jgi:adenylate cyclase
MTSVRTVPAPEAFSHLRPPGRTIRALRTATGLVLVAYVTAHFVNHGLGVISLDAQEALLERLAPIWRSAPGTLLLYGALVIHALLGLYALWRRKTLRMPPWEFAQLALGLAVPLLLIPHVFGTRVAGDLLGTPPTYHIVIAALWDNPVAMLRQPLLVAIVWSHLWIGLHYWLRLRPGYRRLARVFYPVAIIVPALALLGFWGAGIELREINGLTEARDDAIAGIAGAANPATATDAPVDNPAARARLRALEQRAYLTYGGLLVCVLLGRGARRFALARGDSYVIRHASGRTISAPVGYSLLEALRDAGIPHASVCGGRARCTTCRVRIRRSAARLPPPEPIEAAALERIDAAADVRLACQLRPAADVDITPLLPPHVGPGATGTSRLPGREHSVAVMFVDVRDSSRLGEQRMPYDVFFILNRFFAEMAEALRETGGYYSTFNGDGLMALYGIETSLEQACRDALRGSIAIEKRLAAMNAALAHDLPQPLRAGIGIHAGDAIVGTMGPPATPLLSALGDTVNIAARLEAETKRRKCVLVVSADCARSSGLDLSQFAEHTVTVRGRGEPVTYHAIAAAADLAPLLDSGLKRA